MMLFTQRSSGEVLDWLIVEQSSYGCKLLSMLSAPSHEPSHAKPLNIGILLLLQVPQVLLGTNKRSATLPFVIGMEFSIDSVWQLRGTAVIPWLYYLSHRSRPVCVS